MRYLDKRGKKFHDNFLIIFVINHGEREFSNDILRQVVEGDFSNKTYNIFNFRKIYFNMLT